MKSETEIIHVPHKEIEEEIKNSKNVIEAEIIQVPRQEIHEEIKQEKKVKLGINSLLK